MKKERDIDMLYKSANDPGRRTAKLKNIWDTMITISSQTGEDNESTDIFRITKTVFDYIDDWEYRIRIVNLTDNESINRDNAQSTILYLEDITKILRRKYSIKGVIK